jgi:2-C-methyl-D-erythritol 4-phosphate cytidylyltransferase
MQWVKKILLVVDNPERVQGLLEESHANREKVSVVQGENTRHRSIRAGVQALQKNGKLVNIRVHVKKPKNVCNSKVIAK